MAKKEETKLTLIDCTQLQEVIDDLTARVEALESGAGEATPPKKAAKKSDKFDKMDRGELKAFIVNEELEIVPNKSMSDDELREAIREAVAGGTSEPEEDGKEETDAKAGDEITYADLQEMDDADLKEVAKECGVKTKGKDRDDLIAEIATELEIEIPEEDDEPAKPPKKGAKKPATKEEPEEDTSTPITEEELKELSLKELKEVATELGVEVDGLKRDDIISAVLEATGGEAEEEEDDKPAAKGAKKVGDKVKYFDPRTEDVYGAKITKISPKGVITLTANDGDIVTLTPDGKNYIVTSTEDDDEGTIAIAKIWK